MAQVAQQQVQKAHWKVTAIEKSVGITDAWEVTKIYAGRAAEWILFGCMIANIVGILPGVSLPLLMTNIVMGIQIVTLDIAGFGLATMAQNARANGYEEQAKTARNTAYLLITIMMLTLILFTLGLMVPGIRPATDIAEKVLILVRVGLIVLYGHVIHGLRSVTDDQPAPRHVDALQEELNTQARELQRLQEQHTHALQQLSTQHEQRLQTTITEMTETNEARTQELIENLLTQVNEQAQERIEAMQQTITRIAVEQVTTTVTPLLTLPQVAPTVQITEAAIDQGDTKERIRAIYHTDRSLSSRKISTTLGGKPSHPTVQKYLDQIIIEESEA